MITEIFKNEQQFFAKKGLKIINLLHNYIKKKDGTQFVF